jgi:hypothetical protein
MSISLDIQVRQGIAGGCMIVLSQRKRGGEAATSPAPEGSSPLPRKDFDRNRLESRSWKRTKSSPATAMITLVGWKKRQTSTLLLYAWKHWRGLDPDGTSSIPVSNKRFSLVWIPRRAQNDLAEITGAARTFEHAVWSTPEVGAQLSAYQHLTPHLLRLMLNSPGPV